MPAKITLLIYILVSLFGKENFCQLNNSCTTYSSYYNINFSKDCYYNPDLGKDVPEIIDRYIGHGKSEFHEVTTEDGYILGLHRMPQKNPKGVILLQHPLTADAKFWLLQNNQSTGLLFWQAGYDVWLGNNRGSLYSKKHVNLTQDNPKFWDFSFHEIGVYDHHACIQYIKQRTNVSKIIYLGHSMSSTSALIYASTRPKEAEESLKVMILMAPPVYLKNVMIPFIHVAVNFLPLLQLLVGWYSVLNHDSWYLKLVRHFCMSTSNKRLLVAVVVFLCGGFIQEFDPQLINMLGVQFGSETSWKTIYHYVQFLINGEFGMFSYGTEQNLIKYGVSKAPLYEIENIKTPVYVVYSTDDIITTTKDTDLLYQQLPEDVKKYGKLKVSGLSHIDYHTGKSRIVKVYNKLLTLLQTIS